VRAQLRVYVKRILRKYGYPPDKQEKATQTVLEQAEVLSEGWGSRPPWPLNVRRTAGNVHRHSEWTTPSEGRKPSSDEH
jgi:hypothetical protein